MYLQLMVVILPPKTWFILPFSSAFCYLNLHFNYCVFRLHPVPPSRHHILILTLTNRRVVRFMIIKSSSV